MEGNDRYARIVSYTESGLPHGSPLTYWLLNSDFLWKNLFVDNSPDYVNALRPRRCVERAAVAVNLISYLISNDFLKVSVL